MHDVLVHYLEVNFAEIAEQLARAGGRDPGPKERSDAAERLRGLIRRLRREAEASRAKNHAPRVTATEMIAGVNGELRPEERRVLDHFFDLFARSMERTQAASFPDNRFSLHRIAAVLRYWLLRNLALRLGYTYQRFRTSYWQTDFIQQMNGVPPTVDAGTDVFLGVKPFQNYEAHIIGAGISYGF